MEMIFKKPFFVIFFDKSTGLMKSEWLNKNEKLSDRRIKRMILKSSKLIKKYKPKYILSNDISREFVYSLDLQKWVAGTLAEACNYVGVRKFSVLSPKDMLAKISTEQTTESIRKKNYDLKLFYSETEATKWLFSDKENIH